MSDVFAAPREGPGFGTPTPHQGPWHGDDGQVLSLADAPWPELCLRCGSDADLEWVDIVGRSAGDAMAFLAFGGLSLVVNRKVMWLRVPVCGRHRAVRDKRVQVWIGAMAASLLAGGISSWLLWTSLPMLGGVTVALVLAFLVSPGALVVDRVRGRLAYVDGVSSEVRAQLPSATECDAELLHGGT